MVFIEHITPLQENAATELVLYSSDEVRQDVSLDSLSFCEALKTNKSLKRLGIEQIELDKSILVGISDALTYNESIETLSLFQTSMTTFGVLSKSIKANKYIQEFKIENGISNGDVNVDNEMVGFLTAALKVNSSLTKLTLYRSGLGDVAARKIAEALKVNTSLTHLDLEGNNITDVGAVHLGQSLKQNKALKLLNLNSNILGHLGAMHLDGALKKNTTLETILLQHNKLEDAGTTFLFQSLRHNSGLKVLKLGENDINAQGKGTLSLAAALQFNNSITELCLRKNSLSQEGVYNLSQGLKRNKALAILNLENCSIDDKAVISLAKAFKVNKGLTDIDLTSNNITKAGAEKLAESLKYNTSVSQIRLSFNMIGDIGAKHIGNMLKINSALIELDLMHNNIGDIGAAQIGNGLKSNDTLTKLLLGGNKIGATGAVRIADALQSNNNLVILSLFDNTREADRHLKSINAHLSKNKKLKNDKFLSILKGEEKASWNRSRIMFVGHGSAGKSSTVRSLLGKPYNPNWDSTIGANVFESMSRLDASSWRNTDINGDFSSKFAARIMNREKQMQINQNKKTYQSNRFTSYVKKKLGRGRSTKSYCDTDVAASGEEKIADSNNDILELENEEIINTSDISDNRPMNESNDNFLVSAGHRDHKMRIFQGENSIERFDEKLLVDAKSSEYSISLSLWDFGGQKVFYSMHHLFLTKSGFYVIVFDMREILVESNRPEVLSYILFWLKSIKLHANSSKRSMLLVGTFLAEVSDDLKLIDKVLRGITAPFIDQMVHNPFGNLIYFPIDNRGSQGIANLRFTLEKSVQNDVSIYEEVSVRTMALLDRLLILRKNKEYIPLATVKMKAKEVGIRSNFELEHALQLFHQRGVLIHMTATETLKNIIVLQPQWLIDSLSKVIRDNSIHAYDVKEFEKTGLAADLKKLFSQGIASQDILEYIWRDNQPEFLLDLMEQTMLLSKLPIRNEKRYLIPSLLRKQYSGEIMGYRCMFDFSSSFLPNGVFERLICLCVSHNYRHKQIDEEGNLIKTSFAPEVWSNFAKIEFEPGLIIQLFADNVSSQTIIVSVEEMKYANKSVSIIQSMLRKLNDDVMDSGLIWKKKYEDIETGEFMSLETAQRCKLFPWFNSSSAAANEYCETEAENIISSFIDEKTLSEVFSM